MTVAQLIAALEDLDPALSVRVQEPRDDRDNDGTFTAGGVIEADDEPCIYITP